MYVGWRDLRAAKGRFALIMGVVVLITVLVGLLSGLTQGLGQQSTSAVTGLNTPLLVRSAATFDESSVPVNRVPDGTPIGIATMRATAGTRAAAVSVIGVPQDSLVAPDAKRVEPGHIVMSQAAADSLGHGDIRLGDSAFTTVETRGDASYAHLPVVWADLTDWQRLTGSADQATTVAVTSVPGDLPHGWTTASPNDSVSAIPGYSSEHGSLLMIRAFLLAISALVIGAFFTVWTIQRRGDIAVLKALGASTGTLLRDALGQAGVVLVIGTVIGSTIAWLVGLVARTVVPFELGLSTMLPPAALLVLLGLVGASLAVRQVTTVDPLTALNGK